MPDTVAPHRFARSQTDRRMLRRTDWRFLLPVPANGFELMVLLGGPSALADVIVETGLAQRVTQELPARPSADAVVILADGRCGCEEAAGALVPGGAFYWELEENFVRRNSMGRIKLRLLQAGLSPRGVYWVLPSFERGEIFLPVDIRPAMKWYLRSFSSHRVLATSLGASVGASLVGHLTRPCAMTAVAGSAPGGHPSILDHPSVPSDFRQDGAAPLLYNREAVDASRRVIVFPFRPDSCDPGPVLKLWRTEERNADVEEEQQTVAAIRTRLDPMMRRSIPSPLGTFRWGRLVVGGETCAPGRALSQTRGRRPARKIEDLRRVTLWLLEFHRQTHSAPLPFSNSQLQDWVEVPLAAYDAALGASAEERMLFEGTRQRARSLLGSPLPPVWLHPAFSEWNIYRFGETITVIDWEETRIGPPLCDLIYFLTQWYYRSGRKRGEGFRIASFRDLFFSSSRDACSASAWSALDDYLKGLSIDPRVLPVMLVVTCVTHAAGRAKRIKAAGDSRSDPRKGNVHAGYVRVLAENRTRLFPGDAS